MRKKLALIIATFVLLLLVIPTNTKALSKKLYTCEYEVKQAKGDTIKLNYDIYTDKIKLAFEDGNSFSSDKLLWYHGSDFAASFKENIKTSNNKYTCPSLTLEKSNDFYTIFNQMDKNNCNGTCETLVATNLIKNDNKINVVKTTKTDFLGTIGIYNDDAYLLPYFRINNDGSKEWSINGKKYINVNEKAIFNYNGNKIVIELDKKLVNKIYDNNNINQVSLYRCVKKIENNTYAYLISTNKNNCPKKDLSTTDNQQNKSLSYNGALGAKKKDETADLKSDLDDYDQEQTCSGEDSILGNPNDEDSVAWLLQQLLNYLKILGPMIVIVMSSVDFAKAIIKSDDETMSKAQKKLIIRLLLAAALFFVPTLVTVLLQIFGITSDPLCGLQ